VFLFIDFVLGLKYLIKQLRSFLELYENFFVYLRDAMNHLKAKLNAMRRHLVAKDPGNVVGVLLEKLLCFGYLNAMVWCEYSLFLKGKMILFKN
jgi:hypothetical protein